VSTWDLVATVVIVAGATVVQGVSGFGFSLVAMPLLATLLGVEAALVIQTTLGIASNGATALRSRGDVLVGTVRRILASVILGMPFGWLILDRVSGRGLKLLVGVIVALLAMARARRVEIKATGPGVDYVSGFVSGVLSTSTGTAGPPLVIGLSGRGLAAANQRATLSACFSATSLIVFTALLLSGRVDQSDLVAVAASLPVLVVASTTGHQIFDRLQQHHYEHLVIILLFASSAIAIGSALAQ
jgi:uncharacterized membrane protein YfcA